MHVSSSDSDQDNRPSPVGTPQPMGHSHQSEERPLEDDLFGEGSEEENANREGDVPPEALKDDQFNGEGHGQSIDKDADSTLAPEDQALEDDLFGEDNNDDEEEEEEEEGGLLAKAERQSKERMEQDVNEYAMDSSSRR